jgi:hypothetical protein
VELRDDVTTFGYPGAGGDTISVRGGKIAGYIDFELKPDDEVDAYKIDGAASSPGNSGGLATNDQGAQIGIPSAGAPGTGLSVVRMVNFAVPYIEEAVKHGPTPTPTQPGPFGPIVFGTGVSEDSLVGQGTRFPAGTTKIVAGFPFERMQDGTSWGYVWQTNGKPESDKRNALRWDLGDKGFGCCLTLTNDEGLPAGEYQLGLYVEDTEVQRGTFTIAGDDKPRPPPPPPTESVVVTGKIVDADTQRGIPGALFVVLKPGATTDDWNKSSGEASAALVAALGETDADGSYRTAPGLPPGNTHTLVVLAKGYAGRGFERALKLAKDASGVLELKDIPLKKR